MLFNLFKTTWKNLVNRKFYSIVIILGLTIGLASWIFITLWIGNKEKLSGLDENELRLCRISSMGVEASWFWIDPNQVYHYRLFPETPFLLAPMLKFINPEIVEIARFGYFDDLAVTNGINTFTEKRVAFADKEIFRMYRFPMIKGDVSGFGKTVNTAIITKSTADKYFPGENPIGKKLKFADNNLSVIAVIKDIPRSFKIQFDILVPVELQTDSNIINDWQTNRVNTYFLVKKNANLDLLANDINKIIRYYNPPEEDAYQISRLPRYHSYSDIRADAGINGNIEYLLIFATISLFIIFIACINYFSITISQFAGRAKETAIRKAFGASRINIIIQYLLEGQVLSFISLAIAVLLIVLLLPQFNNIAYTDIQINFASNVSLWLKCLLLTVLVGLVAGTYPAFYFSSVSPSKVFSSTLRAGAQGSSFRKIITFLQISISVGLIVSAFKVEKQLDLVRYSEIGYDESYSVELPFTDNFKNSFGAFKYDLLKNSDILNAGIEKSKVIDSDSSLDNKENGLNVIKNSVQIISVTFKPRHIVNNIRYIGSIWDKYESGNPFKYLLVDADLRKEFRTEEIMSQLLNGFSIAATFITLLGLFCLSSYISEQRKHEIAIRKTFGASSLRIYLLLMREFLLISFLAILTADIVVTFTLSAWVKRFTYKIANFGISEYMIAPLIALILIIITVSFHAVRASRQEPAEVLKRE